MLVLNRNDTITIKLAGSAGTQPVYRVDYEDYQTGIGTNLGTLNNTTRVTVCAGNSISIKSRGVVAIAVHNRDVSAITAIVEVYRNSVYYQQYSKDIDPDDTYEFLSGATAVVSGGGGTGDYLGLYNNLSDVPSKQTALNTLTAVVGAENEQILTKDTATGNAVFKTPVQFFAINPKGGWDADTNDPELSNDGGGGVSGDYYIITVAGTTEIDGISSWAIGDWIVNNGVIWQKVPNPNLVTSVNTETGAVTLDSSYVGLENVLNVEQIPATEKGAVNGVATLGGTSKLTDAQLPTPLYEIDLLSPSNNDLIQRKTGAWTNRTPAQLKTDLSLSKSDVGLGSVPNLDTTDAVNNQHTHSNKSTLDATQEAFTTALKATYDTVTGKQTADADLTAIANLSPSNDDVIQRKSGAWTNRTMVQIKADLSLISSDVGLGNVSNDAQLKIASNLSDVAARQTALDNLTAVSGATNEDVLTKDTATGNAIWKTPTGGGGGLSHQQVMSRIILGF